MYTLENADKTKRLFSFLYPCNKAIYYKIMIWQLKNFSMKKKTQQDHSWLLVRIWCYCKLKDHYLKCHHEGIVFLLTFSMGVKLPDFDMIYRQFTTRKFVNSLFNMSGSLLLCNEIFYKVLENKWINNLFFRYIFIYFSYYLKKSQPPPPIK